MDSNGSTMMELPNPEVSLTILKIRLLEARANSAPASGTEPVANQTLTIKQRIFCELQVTGNAEDRGLLAPTSQTENQPLSRRKRSSSRPTYGANQEHVPTSLSRTLAQWSFLPEEMQLPVDYRAAMQFREKPGMMTGWLAYMARSVVSRFLSEMRADTLERMASAAEWLPSGKPMLPLKMMRQLQMLLPSILREGDSLWLQLDEPIGYLPLLPWEEMLRSATKAPILRLSPHPIQALSTNRELSVVLCLSVTCKKCTPTATQLAYLSTAIRRAIPKRSTVHVFADDLCFAPFLSIQNQVGVVDSEGRTIRLYDLPRTTSRDEQCHERWKGWVTKSLDGRAVDIVHCIAPGMLFANDARLVLSLDLKPESNSEMKRTGASNSDGRPLNYITALELCASLTHLGAWAAVFSMPPWGSGLAQTRPGLRLLIDQIGRLRPGMVGFHDFEADSDCKALAETYEFMIGDPSIKASTSSSISLYCHPARAVAVASEPISLADDLKEQYLKVKETVQLAIERGGSMPVWIASIQRILEQAMSRAASRDAKDNEAVMRGLASALKYVDQILADPSLSHPSADETPSDSRRKGITSV
jgi:hypothetical protein